MQRPNALPGILDPTRFLFDLQQGNEIAQSLSGCLDPEEIANRVTEGLVKKFDCAFVRIWLVDRDRAMLRLVASSGLYTHTNGSFAQVPMGAYKVGKIAQNRVSFLSNNLADEPWVGDRDWAIRQQIRGFAGYPLTTGDRTIGVLAAFSHHTIEPEFLEILQMLCNIAAIALDTALHYQKEKQAKLTTSSISSFHRLHLCDQLVSILPSTRLTLVGTEQNLSLTLIYIFLQAAEILNQLECAYCRLVYAAETVALEAIIPLNRHRSPDTVTLSLSHLNLPVSCLGGVLQTQTSSKQRTLQINLKLPLIRPVVGEKLYIRTRFPLIQKALTQLAFLAGLQVCSEAQDDVVILTDDLSQIQASAPILWLQHPPQPLPQGIHGKIDLTVRPEELREAVEALYRGEFWGIEPHVESETQLSPREIEILTLLTQGLRDREIAHHLIISESTVKFHIKNLLKKLDAKTRYQAIHQALIRGLIS